MNKLARIFLIGAIAWFAFSIFGCGNKVPVTPTPSSVLEVPFDEIFTIYIWQPTGVHLPIQVKIVGAPITKKDLEEVARRTNHLCREDKRDPVVRIHIKYDTKIDHKSVVYNCTGDDKEPK